MRIAFLCKRRYMGKDVIDDRYARLYEIPHQLARRGHAVHAFCAGYQGQEAGSFSHDAAPGVLAWTAETLALTSFRSIAYPMRVLRQLQSIKPDVIIGASDIPHIVLAAWLARQLDIPYVADLYDNFESFGQARVPGAKFALRKAVQHANLVWATSQPLADKVKRDYHARGLVKAVPSTVDTSLFRRRDKRTCREALGLPKDAVLIGTAGALFADRGIATVYEAWNQMSGADSRLHLVLAGPADPSCPPPVGDRVLYLGMLSHTDTATLFAALDVGILYLRDTPFGRFCFPQKAYEMVACGLPIAAARVGAIIDFFAGDSTGLYEPDDAASLVAGVLRRLNSAKPSEMPVRSWTELASELDSDLVEVLGRFVAGKNPSR